MIAALIDLLPLGYSEGVVVLGAAAIGLLAGLVGCLAVLRRRAMVGDAMAHAALPGVCTAFIFTGGSKDPFVLLTGALAAGLLAAAAVVLLERRRLLPADASIGVVLSVAFSLGIVLLTLIAGRPDADQAGLERYLFGQAAGLLERDVVAMLSMLGAVLAVLVVLRHPVRAVLFDRGFAASTGLSVTAVDLASTVLLVIAAVTGLQVVGAILMVALLVAPAVAARQWVSSLRGMLVLGGALGAFVGAAGALLASRLAAPAGPVIVLVATGAAGVSLLIAPRRGILARTLLRRRIRAIPG